MVPLRTLLIMVIAIGVAYYAVTNAFQGSGPSNNAPAGFNLGDRFIPVEGLLEISSSDLRRSRLVRRIKTEMLSMECEGRGLELERDELVDHVRRMLSTVRENREVRETMDAIRPGYWEVTDWSDEELEVYRGAVLSMLIAEDELAKNPISEESMELYREEHMELNPDTAPEDLTDVMIRNDLIEDHLGVVDDAIREKYRVQRQRTAHVPLALADEIDLEFEYTNVFTLGYFWVLREDVSRGQVEALV